LVCSTLETIDVFGGKEINCDEVYFRDAKLKTPVRQRSTENSQSAKFETFKQCIS